MAKQVTIPDEAPYMSERQWNYIKDLCAERDQDPMQFHELNKGLASGAIDHLLKLPKVRSSHPGAKDGVRVEYEEVQVKPAPAPPMRIGYIVGLGKDLERVPRGHYALRNSDDPNDLSFYKVWVGTRGGWAVKVLAGPDEHPLARDYAVTIVRAIAVDPPSSSAAYGHAIGRCGICGLRLTNQVSREMGMGPVCRSRVHW